jgi:hypothetical protein
VQLDAGGLAGPVGQAPCGDQPPAQFFQRVVVALGGGPQILRAGPAGEGVKGGSQRGCAARGQVTAQAARAAEGGGQPQAAVREPAVIVLVGPGGAAADLLGQRRQVRVCQISGVRAFPDSLLVSFNGPAVLAALCRF